MVDRDNEFYNARMTFKDFDWYKIYPYVFLVFVLIAAIGVTIWAIIKIYKFRQSLFNIVESEI